MSGVRLGHVVCHLWIGSISAGWKPETADGTQLGFQGQAFGRKTEQAESATNELGLKG